MAARTAHPYADTDVIDSRAPRVNQAFVGSLALLAFATGAEWLVALLAIQLIAGLALGRRWCLPCVTYFELIQPRFGEGQLEDARPPRFANVIGAAVLTAAAVAFTAGLPVIGWSLALLVASLALLAAVSGLCLGCQIYLWIARARRVDPRSPA